MDAAPAMACSALRHLHSAKQVLALALGDGDDSSEASTTIAAACTLQCPPKQLSALGGACGAQGQLLGYVKAVSLLLEAAAMHPEPASRAQPVREGLHRWHAHVVELDAHLDDAQSRVVAGAAAGAALQECRQWLRQAQAYVLSLQRGIDELLASGAAPAAAWALLFRDAADALALVTDDATASGGATDEEGSDVPCTPVQRRARRVCPSSQLSYRGHWASKVAL